MATQKALAVPEVLEHIISYVPAPQILTKAQRVSREWKAAIDSSPTIRRRIWLDAPGKQVVSPITVYNGVYELNTLGLPSKGTMLYHGYRITESYARVRSTSEGIFSHFQLEINVTNSVPGAETRLDAEPTWRAMQIADPPVSAAWAFTSINGHADAESKAVLVSAWATTGITFGVISDVLRKVQPAVSPTARATGYAIISFIADGFDQEIAGEFDVEAQELESVTGCGSDSD